MSYTIANNFIECWIVLKKNLYVLNKGRHFIKQCYSLPWTLIFQSQCISEFLQLWLSPAILPQHLKKKCIIMNKVNTFACVLLIRNGVNPGQVTNLLQGWHRDRQQFWAETRSLGGNRNGHSKKFCAPCRKAPDWHTDHTCNLFAVRQQY